VVKLVAEENVPVNALQVALVALPPILPESVTVSPLQILKSVFALEIAAALTAIVKVIVSAHCPALGVKVYVVVAALFKAGDQVPVKELLEVVGKAASDEPEQIGATAVKVGVTIGLTITDSVVVTAHCPTAGVKVYVVVDVLLSGEFQVPIIPFKEVDGKGGGISPKQIGATAVKVGVTIGLTITDSVAVTAHCPAVGVNV
jgi:hypothetical protein